MTGVVARIWHRSKFWPWWAHMLAVLACLGALGAVFDLRDGGRVTPGAQHGAPVAGLTTTDRAAVSSTIPGATATPPADRDGLGQLVVAAPYTAAPYRRAAFGDDWIDADGDCHNTRAEVLMAESSEPVTFNANGCTVATGRWVDPWSGFTSPNAPDFQIDHLVPLADAWRSGAWAWTDKQRGAFAQNLDDPDELNATSGASNNAKGDKTPDQWKPADRSSWCRCEGMDSCDGRLEPHRRGHLSRPPSKT